MNASITRFAILLMLTPLPFFVGCDGGSDDGAEAAAEQLEQALAPRDVRLTSPELREEHSTVDLVGEIRAFETVAVSSEVAGKVDRVLVEVGDRVAAGVPLVEVDRDTYAIYLEQARANLAAARADLALAEKELERKRDLRSDETISQAAFDQANAAFDQAVAREAASRAALALAERNFDRSVVRAPAPGAITERHVVAGQWAEVGVGLLELAVGDKVKVAAQVPEGWARKLGGIETFTFTVGADDTVHTARVFSVQPAVDQASRSFEIVGTAANDGTMKPGMFATITLQSPEAQQTLWLPDQAIATSDLPQVLMVEDGTVVYRKVQVGRRDDGHTEIVSGLSADEKVIADVAGLSRGIPVSIVGGADNG